MTKQQQLHARGMCRFQWKKMCANTKIFEIQIFILKHSKFTAHCYRVILFNIFQLFPWQIHFLAVPMQLNSLTVPHLFHT